jgi:acetylornithine/succinyldiaminopimelate/putrescine aminotransferase
VAFNDLEATRAAVGPETCAIFLEPVQGESGIYPATPEFMRGLEALCREKGLLLMVDEVQTAFGRTGRYWAYEHYGVEPDIVTTAKALAGGLPIGAILAKPEVASAFQPGDHGCTFGGNPFSCAGALAALQALDEGKCIENAATVGELLKSRLSAFVGRGNKVTEVRGLGLMLGVELGEPIGKAVFDRCLEAGLVINNVGDTILRLIPPVILTREQAEEGVGILEKAIFG